MGRVIPGQTYKMLPPGLQSLSTMAGLKGLHLDVKTARTKMFLWFGKSFGE